MERWTERIIQFWNQHENVRRFVYKFDIEKTWFFKHQSSFVLLTVLLKRGWAQIILKKSISQVAEGTRHKTYHLTLRGRTLLMGNTRPECFPQNGPKFWDPLSFQSKFWDPLFIFHINLTPFVWLKNVLQILIWFLKL